jgi:hypothetical protein
MLFWLGIVWRTMFHRRLSPMTTRDETSVIFEQRCNQGHLHVYVVPRYVADCLMLRFSRCTVLAVDKDLMNEASAVIENGY